MPPKRIIVDLYVGHAVHCCLQPLISLLLKLLCYDTNLWRHFGFSAKNRKGLAPPPPPELEVPQDGGFAACRKLQPLMFLVPNVSDDEG